MLRALRRHAYACCTTCEFADVEYEVEVYENDDVSKQETLVISRQDVKVRGTLKPVYPCSVSDVDKANRMKFVQLEKETKAEDDDDL